MIREWGRPGDLGWVVQAHGELYASEYGFDSRFEALVAGIVASYAAGHSARERGWIAEVDGERAGCVLCVDAREGDTVDAGKSGTVDAGEGGAVDAGEGGTIDTGKSETVDPGEGGTVDVGEGDTADAGEGGTAVLRLLLVTPAARGRGAGAALVDTCLSFARDAGYRRMRLWTTDPLVAARRLYLSRGFRLIGSAPHDGFGVPVIGQTYARTLD